MNASRIGYNREGVEAHAKLLYTGFSEEVPNISLQLRKTFALTVALPEHRSGCVVWG